MSALLLTLVVNGIALAVTAWMLPKIKLSGFLSMLFAAMLFGLANTFIKPVLVILTLPVTFMTLGLFLLVINAFLFWLVAKVVKGFEVDGFFAALLGAIVYSILSWIINGIIF